MTTALTKPVAPQDFRQLASVAFWVMKTFVMAWISPYVIVGMFFAAISVMGASVEDVRQNFTMMASMDANSWLGMGKIWHWLSIFSYSGVIIYRVFCSSIIFDVSEKFDTWAKAKFGKKYSPSTIGIICSALLLSLFIISPPNNTPRDLNGLPLSLSKQSIKPLPPQAMAAITLKDGTIKSGDAVVTQEAEGRYVVTFTPKDLHESSHK